VTVGAVEFDHKAYYLGAHQLRITGDRQTGRLLGAQLLGHHRAEVAKRIDIPATALFHHMTVEGLSDLDLSYPAVREPLGRGPAGPRPGPARPKAASRPGGQPTQAASPRPAQKPAGTRAAGPACLPPQRRAQHRRRGPAQRPPAPGCGGDSAGTDPADALNPTVVTALAERGITLAGVSPKPATAELLANADLVVTMSRHANGPAMPRRRPPTVRTRIRSRRRTGIEPA
jgi:low molecular weight phosphotyrosine protein phosphatase